MTKSATTLHGPPTSPWVAFLAHLLFILAAWSLFIKYAFPMAFSLAAGEPLTRHIRWDLWPVVHVWLGWALLARPPYTWWFALLVSLAEIIIVITLLAAFLVEPDWSMWGSNWFVNKVFVLSCFLLLLGTVVLDRQALGAMRSG